MGQYRGEKRKEGKNTPSASIYPLRYIDTWRKGRAAVYIREKKTDCADYREVDIIPRTEQADMAVRGRRGKRKKAKRPKQNALNDKNAKRYLVQLGNGNFHAGDLHVTVTYSKDHLPGTVEEAEKIVNNYLRRLAYRRKKQGLAPLKYILATEYKLDKAGGWLKRIHHHIIMNEGLDRSEVEMMWTNTRINWKRADSEDKQAAREYRRSIEQLGFANADRIQTNENGIEALCKYITKDPQGKKRYSSSRNLERPETERVDSTAKEKSTERMWRASRNLTAPTEKCNDFKYSRRKVERLAMSPDGGLSEFQKIYADYNITSCEPIYYEQTGWHIYLKMWKKKTGGTRNAKKRKCGTSGRSAPDL
jgi:hypothetical protein